MSSKSGDNTFALGLMILIIIVALCAEYWKGLEKRVKNGETICIIEKMFLVFLGLIAYCIVDFIITR